MALVPTFREAEIDSYFNAFERLAIALKWPEEMWPSLLQCKINGKAQEVVSALPLADSLKYDVVREAILRAYELVPEAYRQKFRGHRKSPTQTFVEFARDKGALFDRWCSASKVTDFGELRELILIEEFKRSLPDRLVVHINEHKVTSLSAAAVMADEFTKGLGLIGGISRDLCPIASDQGSDPCFQPFIIDGLVSLPENPERAQSIPILRDTGASQTVILGGVVPFSDSSACVYNVVLSGTEMGYVPRPLHKVRVDCQLVSGVFPVAVCPVLPITGVTMLLGNDIAGGQVVPALEILDTTPRVPNQAEKK